MSKFLLRMVINGVALYAAIALVPGIQPENPDPISYVWLALIFGILNALLKPLIVLLTCPFYLLTLGLFSLLVNTGLFYLTGWLGRQFNVGFTIDSFWSALLGALVVSVIGMVFNVILKDELKGRPPRKPKV